MQNNLDKQESSTTFHTTEEIEIQLGQGIRAARLRKNWDQKTLAKRSGIGVTSLARLEHGQGSTLTTVIRVTRSLGLLHWTHILMATDDFNPLEYLEFMKRKSVRQRASRKTKTIYE